MKGKLDISLHERYDILLKEFHPTLNGELKLTDFTCGSNTKVWWKCPVADDHEWEALIYKRINGNGCSCCRGLKVVLSNCLATTNPEAAEQWNHTKNFPLTPFDVTAKSNKKVWWKCSKENDHEWESTISNKTRDSTHMGCNCCAGKKVVLSNCLSTTHPEISKKFHPTKNLPLTPFDVTFGSDKKVWWQCDKNENHEWSATIIKVTTGNTDCPDCNDSHGERKIKNILNEMNIHYEIEKKFDDCKHKQKLPFDFYIPKYNILIEYDGEQHFRPIKIFGGITKFNKTKEMDKIKTEYATKNNIPLLRISYTRFDFIEEEIKCFLNSFNE